MKRLENMLAVLLTLVFMTALAGGSLLQASDAASSGQAGGAIYLPSKDALADVNHALNSAREKNKLVLVVMGANWCHDSRALAARLFEEPLRSIIDLNYETVFVDVGFLDQGREVISRFGPPVYYATPTVLIVDPLSDLLLNADNRHQWGNASKISMEESADYFQQMAQRPSGPRYGPDSDAGDLAVLLQEIASFELLQAERLYAAYAFVGPLLSAYEDGQSPANFEAYWNELRDFRLALALDIDALRLEARQRVAQGESQFTLQYPEYTDFSWENPEP